MAGDTQKSFRPARWLSNPHLQTLWPRVCRLSKDLHFDRQILELDDGDFVEVDWYGNPLKARAIAILLHGLEGCAQSNYIQRLAHELKLRGISTAALNFRGCGSGPNRQARAYHSGDTADFATLSEHIQQQHPDKIILAAGFSLGGNVLLKWLGENPEQKSVQAAAAVSVPFDLAQSGQRLQQGLSRIYQHRLLTLLKRKLKVKSNLVEIPFAIDKAFAARTFYQFDDAFTAPIHGFESAADYYNRSSSGQYLQYIETSCLILHALDDPFLSQASIPTEAELGSSIVLDLSPHGGHVGFVAHDGPIQGQGWMPQRIADYFESALVGNGDCF